MMNTDIIRNYLKLKPSLFVLPLFLLIAIFLFLYSQNALSVDGYIGIQKKIFFPINHFLGQYPDLQINFTQVGDGLIFLSLLSIFILYAPKIWEALISGLLVSVLFSFPLKRIFNIPRPAEYLDNATFIIIGRRLTGFSSFPSGHSITIFTVLTVLLFAFMPKKAGNKIIWSLFIVTIGLIFAFTRVGVGAHHPIDVMTGSIIGYISGISGIFISRKYKIWNWINERKYYPFFIVLFLTCCVILFNKIMKDNLVIFYLSFVSLLFSLYKITTVYVKNIKK